MSKIPRQINPLHHDSDTAPMHEGFLQCRSAVGDEGEGFHPVFRAHRGLKVGEREVFGLRLPGPPMDEQTHHHPAPRSNSPLGVCTRQRSSLSDTSRRWWLPFSIPQPCYALTESRTTPTRLPPRPPGRRNKWVRKPVMLSPANLQPPSGGARNRCNRATLRAHRRAYRTHKVSPAPSGAAKSMGPETGGVLPPANLQPPSGGARNFVGHGWTVAMEWNRWRMAGGGERIGFRGSRRMVSPSGWTVSWGFE